MERPISALTKLLRVPRLRFARTASSAFCFQNHLNFAFGQVQKVAAYAKAAQYRQIIKGGAP